MLKMLQKLSRRDWGYVAVCLAFIATQVWLDMTMPKFRKVQQLTDDLNRVTRENLGGLRVVRAYNAEGYQEAKFEGANGALPQDRIAMFGDMMVFTQYGMQVVMAFMSLVMIFMILPRASVSAKRVNEVLDTIPAIQNGQRIEGKKGVTGEIEFKNVTFQYPDAEEPVLRHHPLQHRLWR